MSDSPAAVMDWNARHMAVVNADGDEWDRLHEKFDADWKAAYGEAFVSFAMTRNWTLDAAVSWPGEIVDDALTEAHAHDFDPVRAATADVIDCEWESV